MSESKMKELDRDAIAGLGASLTAVIRQLAIELNDDELVRLGAELGDLARHDPGTMFAGSVALGFGLARIRDTSGVRLDGTSIVRADVVLAAARGNFDAEEHLDLSANAGGETPPKPPARN